MNEKCPNCHNYNVKLFVKTNEDLGNAAVGDPIDSGEEEHLLEDVENNFRTSNIVIRSVYRVTRGHGDGLAILYLLIGKTHKIVLDKLIVDWRGRSQLLLWE